MPRARFGVGPAADESPGHQAGQQLGLLLRGPGPGHGGGDDVRRGQRPRRGAPAELERDQGQVAQALAAHAAAAVGLGHQQRRPAQVGALAPEVAAEPRRVAAHLAQQRGRDLVVQELARRPVEERLLRGQIELHRPAGLTR